MKKSHIQLLVGTLISLVFLYFALKGVNIRELLQAMKSFNWLWALPFLAVTIFTMWLRAWRWHYFLKPSVNLTTKQLFGPMMAGFALNGLLPARIGEFARAYILGKKYQLPFTKVFATIVVERIFDTLTLLVLLTFVFSTLKFDDSVSFVYSTKGSFSSSIPAIIFWVTGIISFVSALYFNKKSDGRVIPRLLIVLALMTLLTGIIFATLAPKVINIGNDYTINGETLKGLSVKITVLSLGLLCGVLALLYPPLRNLGLTIVKKLPLIPVSLKEKFTSIIIAFTEGLSSLKDWKTVLIIILQSLAIWMLTAWTMQILPNGFVGMGTMTISEATALLVITCLAILIPAAPGYWGLMELGIKFGMIILNIDNDPNRIMAYALLVHSLQYFSITGIGLVALWKDNVRISEISDNGAPQS